MFIRMPGDKVAADDCVKFTFCSTANRRKGGVGIFDQKLSTKADNYPPGVDFCTQELAPLRGGSAFRFCSSTRRFSNGEC